MSKMKIKTGDTVMILTGDDENRGKTGKVLQVSPGEGKVIVEGRNFVSKHVKPRKAGDPSGIVKAESAIYASKVALFCPKCEKGVRTRTEVADGKKVRVCTKCGYKFD